VLEAASVKSPELDCGESGAYSARLIGLMTEGQGSNPEALLAWTVPRKIAVVTINDPMIEVFEVFNIVFTFPQGAFVVYASAMYGYVIGKPTLIEGKAICLASVASVGYSASGRFCSIDPDFPHTPAVYSTVRGFGSLSSLLNAFKAVP